MAEPNLSLLREQQLRKMREHLSAAAKLGKGCGIPETEAADLLRRAWEDA